jgi:tetratricopeptide (TPR) repeat protein
MPQRPPTLRVITSSAWLRFACFAAAAALVLATGPSAWAGLLRDVGDQGEVDGMRAAKPHAFELLEQGEALAVAGRTQDADALFLQALSEYGAGTLLRRRHCEALTALGRRPEALQQCYQALQDFRSNQNVRATIRALVSGPSTPAIDQVQLALDLLDKHRTRSAEPFTAPAALCDIAASLGDGIMLRYCAAELQRIAPKAPETLRAQALLSTACLPWRFWVGWGAIAALVLTTLGHALRRFAGRSPRRLRASASLVGGVLCAALSTLPSSVLAEESATPGGSKEGMLSKFPVNDEDPDKSIPDEQAREHNPLQFGYWLQDVIHRAEVYSKHGKHDVAVKLYGALAKAVPERAISFVKMCEEYEALGDREKAVASCGAALLREGVLVRDYEHFVRLVLATPGPISDKQSKAVVRVLAHMKDEQAGRAAADQLECEVGVRLSNAQALESCIARLSVTAPDSPETISYRWSLAMIRGQIGEAKQLVEQAKNAGVKPEGVAGMERAIVEVQSNQHRFRVILGLISLALLLGGAGVAAMSVVRRRATPRPA